jgi:hypothetical protein
MNFITNVSYTQSQTLQADSSIGPFAHLYTKNTTLGETISWTTNIRKNFDMNLSAASSYSIPVRSGYPGTNSKSGGNASLTSFTETVSSEFTAYTNNGWLIAASFDYTYTYTHSSNYNVSAPVLTPSIAKQLFKKKNGELRFAVFDVFDKNTLVSKNVSANGESFTKNNVLSRYAMLTFTYNLNNFPGAQRRGPGAFPGRFMGRPPGGGGFRGGPLYPID